MPANPTPTSDMTTGEAEAWRAALRHAATIARRVEIPGECGPVEAHGRMVGALAASEAILAELDPPA